MKLLLDTHVFLWAALAPARLNARAQTFFEEMRHALFLSPASSWEIAIKAAMAKLELPEPPASFVPSRMAAAGVRALPIEHVHALQVATLPARHADPFDRMLVAQAQVERMVVLTADPVFELYEVESIWASREPPPGPTRRKRR